MSSLDDREPNGTAPSSGRRERRRAPRVTINDEFGCFEGFVHDYVSDVSRTGLLVRTRQRLPVGTRVRVRFTAIGSEPYVIEGVGRVARLQDEPPGLGIELCELSDEARGQLERLLRDHGIEPSAAEGPGEGEAR